MRYLTLSKAGLLDHCQAWLRDDLEWNERGNADSDFGNAVDRLLRDYVNDSVADETDVPPEVIEVWQHVAMWIQQNAVPSMRSQVAFAWRPSEDRAWEIVPVPGMPARAYADPEWRARLGLLDEDVCGTVDVIADGIDAAGAFLDIIDLKVEMGGHHRDAAAQLNGLAMVASKARGIERVRVRKLRADARGAAIEGETWLDDFNHSLYAEALTAGLQRVPAAEPVPGAHCVERFCPALVSCPRTQQDVASAEALLPVDALVPAKREFPIALTLTSPDHAAHVLARARAIKKAAEQLISIVGEYVGEGKQLDDGSELRPTFRLMPRVDNKALEQLALSKGATEDEVALCVRVVREGAGLKVLKGSKRGGKAA